MIKILELNALGEEQCKAIRSAESVCKIHDGLRHSTVLDSSLNISGDLKCFYLLYNDSKLLCFLKLFVPSRDEAELSSFTLPEYRRRGYMNMLYYRAQAELKKFSIPDILFVCESRSEAGKGSVRYIGAQYDHSEYSMRYGGKQPYPSVPSRLTLFAPQQEDLENLTLLSCAVFGDSREATGSILQKTLLSPRMALYAAKWNGQLVGMASVGTENGKDTIYGFGILPAHRGKGFGGELLCLILDDLTEKGHADIHLEVDTDNKVALHIYEKFGFETVTTLDYYRKKIL